MGAVVLLYGGFRLWRARRMLLKSTPKENESSTIEKDEA
jgi:threonine/homoserine/homoserine lactone efflux protein